ncbi:hypothetical protein [Phenylobacterium sp.]|uniref:hypothetical protein n=1 Tax=Phenylobacterium sp. TaxID=1871053 RepID=UPI0026324079|nr:hypothetical protein [Phenylobacterium sp.]
MANDDPRAGRRPGFVGWALDRAQRDDLLRRLPPRYRDVVADHVTLKFGGGEGLLPTDTWGDIVGEADDGTGVQAMVVAIRGTTDRPDGSTYHITWSLAPGRDAKESNEVIARLGWRSFSEPVRVRLEPKAYGR